MPRKRRPTLSPAWPSSNSLRNISTPVTTVFLSVPKPTISTSSPTLILPRSILPVATVPRPVIEKTSSTGIRNGLSTSRFGTGMLLSRAACSSSTLVIHCLSRSEEHTSELQSLAYLVCRLLLEKKKKKNNHRIIIWLPSYL